MSSFFTFAEAHGALFNRVARSPSTQWLHHVASGGAYGHFPEGTWVRVPIPRIGGRKRKKKPLQIGDLGYCYRVAKVEMEVLESELASVCHEIMSLEENFKDGAVAAKEAFDELVTEEASLREAVDLARMKVNNLHCEMEHTRSKRTGTPLSETSFTKMLLRGNEE